MTGAHVHDAFSWSGRVEPTHATFFVGEAEVQKALRKLVGILEAEGVPYAIIGALALNEYGHRRVTVDVDLILREEALQAFKRRWLGKGYAERVPGRGSSSTPSSA